MSNHHPQADVVDEARRLAGLGILVFPCRGKAPWPRCMWKAEATCDSDTIEGWGNRYPGCNLGMAMGRGVFGVDLDGPEGVEAFASICDGHSFPATATSITGRADGGRHLLLRCDESAAIKNNVGILPGVDLRSDGGYLVAPPSVHPDTAKRYAWDRDPAEGIAKAPDWFLDMVKQAGGEDGVPQEPTKATRAERSDPEPTPTSRSPAEVAALASYAIAKWPVLKHGTRHVMMRDAIWSMTHGDWDVGAIEAAMRKWHAHFFSLGRCTTSHAEHAREVRLCLRLTLSKVEAGQGYSSEDHSHKVVSILGSLRVREEHPPFARIERTHTIPGGESEFLDDQKLPPIDGRTIRSRGDQQFVAAVLAVFLYEQRRFPGGPYRWTMRQVAEVAGKVFGVKWGDQQLERFAGRFLTRPAISVRRPAKRASRWELAIMLDRGQKPGKGSPGIPSTFQPTGLLSLLS